MYTILHFTQDDCRFISPVRRTDILRGEEFVSFMHRHELISFCERHFTDFLLHRREFLNMSFHNLCLYIISNSIAHTDNTDNLPFSIRIHHLFR